MNEFPGEAIFPTEPQCRIIATWRDGGSRTLTLPMSMSVAEKVKERMVASRKFRQVDIEPMPDTYVPKWNHNFREWLAQ
jgi:hypothetical protein